jgi:hypothetical protein
MKHLILYNHMGTKLLDLEVFVEGQDFTFKAPTPTAFWLGKICLVDKELEPEQPTMESVIGTPTWEVAVEKEEKVELTEANNKSARDSRIGEASEPESPEGLLEQPAGGKPTKRSKKPRKC